MLEKIFGSENRVKILEIILKNIETTFSIIELSKNVEISYGTVRRELINLEEANLITFQKKGREKKYRVNPEHPILNNLKKIFIKTQNKDKRDGWLRLSEIEAILDDELNKKEEDENQYFHQLEECFEKKNLKILPVEMQLNNIKMDNLVSYFIGENYNFVKPFTNKIKSAMQSKKIFMPLKSYIPMEVSKITNLGTILHEKGFLKKYYYKGPYNKFISAKINSDGHMQYFLSGIWLENYVKIVIIQVIERLKQKLGINIKYQIFNNILVVTEDDEKVELDIIFIIENKFIYWVECRTNEYENVVTKYSKFAKKYDFVSKRTFIVSGRIDSNGEKFVEEYFNFQIISVENFKQSIYNQILDDIKMD
ncbi:MAG: hypothetical protein FWH29_09765 [Methanobrevibacter sp.]|nr:hypothetical protein [Methanobrevibacter sp.]